MRRKLAYTNLRFHKTARHRRHSCRAAYGRRRKSIRLVLTNKDTIAYGKQLVKGKKEKFFHKLNGDIANFRQTCRERSISALRAAAVRRLRSGTRLQAQRPFRAALPKARRNEKIARHSARFYALRAARCADGSRLIPTNLPVTGFFYKPKAAAPKGSRLCNQKHRHFVKLGFHVGMLGKTSNALNSVPSRYISKWQWLPKEYPVLPT